LVNNIGFRFQESNMARPFSGEAHLRAAQELRDKARTAAELRQALAVLLPLQCGLSLAQTADILGRSREATCRLRTEFIAQQEGRLPERPPTGRPTRQERLAHQASVLEEVLNEASRNGIVAISPLKPLIEAKLGKTLCLATLYNMLARHGWRKVPPNAPHSPNDAQSAGRMQWEKDATAT
jgi:hypothetical protein